MYVCVCHGFTDGDVRSVRREGGTVSDLYRGLNVRPTCGKCVPTVRDLIRPTARAGLTEGVATP